MSEFPPPELPPCYRHPQKLTGRSCTRCGRPACGDCLRPASIGSLCPECMAASRPTVRVQGRDWARRQTSLVAQIIIAINVLVFFWVLSGNLDTVGFSGPVSQREFDLGLNELILAETHEWYRLVTAGFLHFGLLHIGMNMFLLYQLGNLLEPALGRLRFTLLYAACLLGGSLGVLVIETNSRGLHGGASGAVFGLMAAAAVGMQRRGINVFRSGIGTLLAINLILTFTIPGISIGGHLGGAVTGAVCGAVMLAPAWKPTPTWFTYAFPTLVAVFAVAASIVVVG